MDRCDFRDGPRKGIWDASASDAEGGLNDLKQSLGEAMEEGSPLEGARQWADPSGMYRRMQSVLLIVA